MLPETAHRDDSSSRLLSSRLLSRLRRSLFASIRMPRGAGIEAEVVVVDLIRGSEMLAEPSPLPVVLMLH